MFTGMENLRDSKAAEIAQLVVNHNPMVITSNYKGVILSQTVQVLSILQGQAIFQAPEPILCSTLKEKIYLYSRASREVVSARLLKLNTVMGKLELADLTFTGWRWNERQSDRVQPQDPIIVFVEQKKMLVQANLDNLSVKGMSLLTCNYTERFLHSDHSSPVRLTFQLPDSDGSLVLKGKVIHAYQVGKLAILGVQFMTNTAQKKRINHYVMARKAEILGELKRIFQESCEQHWIPDLYH